MKNREEIKQLAEKMFDDIDKPTRSGKDKHSYLIGVQEGYTQCQEDMIDKKLDEDDINEMALDFIINTGGLPKTIEEWQNALWKFYQSLNKQD